MKRLAWLLLPPLASGALFGQTGYSITGTVPNGTVGVSYSASLQTNPKPMRPGPTPGRSLPA